MLNIKQNEQSLTYLVRDSYYSILTYLLAKKKKKKKEKKKKKNRKTYAHIILKAAFFGFGAVRRPAMASAAAASKTERELTRLAG